MRAVARDGSKAPSPTKAKPKRTKATNSPAWPAPSRAPNGERRPRRRGRRGGRRRRGGGAGRRSCRLDRGRTRTAVGSGSDRGGRRFRRRFARAGAFAGAEPEPVAPTPRRSLPERRSRAGSQPDGRAPRPPRRSRPGGRAGRGTAAVDRARESQLLDQRASRTPAPAPSATAQPEPAPPRRPGRARAGRIRAEAAPRKAGWWSRRFGGGE